MNKVIVALLLICCVAHVGAAEFVHGSMTTSAFDWKNGGGLPLAASFKENGYTDALARFGLLKTAQKAISGAIKNKAPRRFDLRDFEGQIIGDWMVSGEGDVAEKPRIRTKYWKYGRTTMASYWFVIDVATGEQYEVIIADVCGNLIVRRVGKPIACVCRATDACR